MSTRFTVILSSTSNKRYFGYLLPLREWLTTCIVAHIVARSRYKSLPVSCSEWTLLTQPQRLVAIYKICLGSQYMTDQHIRSSSVIDKNVSDKPGGIVLTAQAIHIGISWSARWHCRKFNLHYSTLNYIFLHCALAHEYYIPLWFFN